jgi:hypothetical protein
LALYATKGHGDFIMSGYGWAPLAWVILLVASWPYVERVRHPSISHGAAWLLFVATFSAMASVLLGLLTALAADLHPGALPERPLEAIALLALAFAPALMLGRWLIARPLRRMPFPGE